MPVTLFGTSGKYESQTKACSMNLFRQGFTVIPGSPLLSLEFPRQGSFFKTFFGNSYFSSGVKAKGKLMNEIFSLHCSGYV